MSFAVVIGLVAWLTSAPTIASGTADTTTDAVRGGIALRWRAPTGCGDADGVLDDALALLVDPVDPGVTLRVEASVVVRERAALVLRIGDGPGASERHLEVARCDALVSAAALLVAMAIDPSVGGSITDAIVPEPDAPIEPAPIEPAPIEPAPIEPARIEPAPVAVVESPPAPSPLALPTDPRTPLHLGASLGAGLGAFTLPRVTAALELDLSLATRTARVELGATWWAPTEGTSTSNARVRGRFQLAAAVLRGCVVPRWRALEFPLCAVAQAGAILGRGTAALPDPRSARAPWIAVGGGPSILWRPRRAGGRLGLWLRAEGHGALTRPAFETAPSGLVWRAGPGALVVQAGAELRLWSRR